jgi:nitroreductase
MDIIETINARKSIRSFKADPVPKKLLTQIMNEAIKAPSWGNSQPWEFAIAGGSKLQEIKKGILARVDEEPAMEVARPQIFPDLYNGRMQALGKKELETLGIKREDKIGRGWWRLQNYNNYNAPCVIYILTGRDFYFQEKGVNSWPIFDCGLVAENIMLLAASYGLGTIVQAQAVAYPDVIRKALAIPNSKLIIVGIAIGYPDWDNKIAHFRADKDPLAKVATWYGFGE